MTLRLADLEPDEGGPGIPRAGACGSDSEDAEELLVPVLARWHDASVGLVAAAGQRYQSDSHARSPHSVPRSINLDRILVIGTCSRSCHESREGNEASGKLAESGFYQSSQTKPRQYSLPVSK